MNEQDLLNTLIQNLEQLGYPKHILKAEVQVSLGNKRVGYIDLAVIDENSGEIIAIFEVKKLRFNIRAAAQQIIYYAKTLSPNTLCFAYVGDGEKVEIAQVNQSDGFIKPIDTLPTYEDLKSEYHGLEKFNVEPEKATIKPNSAKKWSSVVAGVSSALSIAIVASMVFQLSGEQKSLTKQELEARVILLEEQSQEQKDEYEQLILSIDKANSSIESLSKIPDSHGWKVEASKFKTQLEQLQKKLQALENALTVSPEKALSVPILRKDLDNTEKNLRAELKQTRAEIDRMYDQNKWFIGLMFTIALSVLGIAISSFYNRNDT